MNSSLFLLLNLFGRSSALNWIDVRDDNCQTDVIINESLLDSWGWPTRITDHWQMHQFSHISGLGSSLGSAGVQQRRVLGRRLDHEKTRRTEKERGIGAERKTGQKTPAAVWPNRRGQGHQLEVYAWWMIPLGVFFVFFSSSIPLI